MGQHTISGVLSQVMQLATFWAGFATNVNLYNPLTGQLGDLQAHFQPSTEQFCHDV